jgi:hypothetical protein
MAEHYSLNPRPPRTIDQAHEFSKVRAELEGLREDSEIESYILNEPNWVKDIGHDILRRRAEQRAEARHESAMEQDRVLHKKTQMVAWIAVGVSLVGVIISAMQCRAN